jgi:hypothetical protein
MDRRQELTDSAVIIRTANEADAEDLRRLAALDSARPLSGAVLVAESDGRLQAALSLDERRAVADPFRPTAALVMLLQARAGLLGGVLHRRPLRITRLRPVTARP